MFPKIPTNFKLDSSFLTKAILHYNTSFWLNRAHLWSNSYSSASRWKKQYPQVSLTNHYPHAVGTVLGLQNNDMLMKWPRPSRSMLWSLVHIPAKLVCLAYFTVPPSGPVAIGNCHTALSTSCLFLISLQQRQQTLDLGQLSCRKTDSAKMWPCSWGTRALLLFYSLHTNEKSGKYSAVTIQ